jgi:hypothetical protein
VSSRIVGVRRNGEVGPAAKAVTGKRRSLLRTAA